MGGEALPPVLAARFGHRLPNAHLHNAYGPTETTVDATGTLAPEYHCLLHYHHWTPRVASSTLPMRHLPTARCIPADMSCAKGADCAGYDVTAEFKGGASVPIGRPINNMRCYVLDPQLQLLPVSTRHASCIQRRPAWLFNCPYGPCLLVGCYTPHSNASMQ